MTLANEVAKNCYRNFSHKSNLSCSDTKGIFIFVMLISQQSMGRQMYLQLYAQGKSVHVKAGQRQAGLYCTKELPKKLGFAIMDVAFCTDT